MKIEKTNADRITALQKLKVKQNYEGMEVETLIEVTEQLRNVYRSCIENNGTMAERTRAEEAYGLARDVLDVRTGAQPSL